MGYRRAEQILPAHIIELIQSYVDGECIYIPRKENERRSWGESTDARREIQARNQMIYLDYLNGAKVKELASAYFLSEKSIQRILREKRKSL